MLFRSNNYCVFSDVSRWSLKAVGGGELSLTFHFIHGCLVIKFGGPKHDLVLFYI